MGWGPGIPLRGADGAGGPPGTPFPPVPARSSLAAYLNSGWASSFAGGVERIDAVSLPGAFTTTEVDIPLVCGLSGLVTAVEASVYITGAVDQLRLDLIAPDSYAHEILIGWDAGGAIGASPGTTDASRVVIADDGPVSSAHTSGAHTGRMHPDDGYCDWNNTTKAMNSPARFGGRTAAGTWILRGRHYFASGAIQIQQASLTITAADDDTHAASFYKWAERVYLEGLVRWAGASETSNLITGTPLPAELRPPRQIHRPVAVHPRSPAAVRGFFGLLRVNPDGTVVFEDGLYSAAGRPAGGSTAIPVGTVFSLDDIDWRAAP